MIKGIKSISMAINKKKSVSYSICYKAIKDGESPETFKELCNAISPLLFLIETTDGYRLGAFTSLYFGNDIKAGYRKDEQAFISSFYTGKKYIIVHPEYTISDAKGNYPMFVKRDIVIGKSILSESDSYAMYPVS